MEDEILNPEETPTLTGNGPAAPSATVTMFRKHDGRYNYVAPENVQDYLDSGLWTVKA